MRPRRNFRDRYSGGLEIVEIQSKQLDRLPERFQAQLTCAADKNFKVRVKKCNQERAPPRESLLQCPRISTLLEAGKNQLCLATPVYVPEPTTLSSKADSATRRILLASRLPAGKLRPETNSKAEAARPLPVRSPTQLFWGCLNVFSKG